MMNWRTNLLALSVYAVLALIAGSAVFFTMRQWSLDVRQAETVAAADRNRDQAGQPAAAHLDVSIDNPREETRQLGPSDDLAMLRTLLDERNQQIDSLRRQLQTATKQRQDLQERYDRMLSMMEDWLELVDTMDTAEPGSAKTDKASAASRTTEDNSRTVKDVERRVADLQDELTAMAIDLAERDAQVSDLTEQMIECRSMIPLIATRLLKPAAEQVLPGLRTMLSDPNAVVRQAACELIAAMGPAAHETEEALRAMLEVETDPELKRLANAALEAVAD